MKLREVTGCKILLVVLLAVLLAAMAVPAPADAATETKSYKAEKFLYDDYGQPLRIKIYGKYYWSDFNSIYVADSKSGSGKVLAAAPSGYFIDDCFVTNGTRMYYSVKSTDYANEATIFYRVQNSGKSKPVKIKKVKSNNWIVSYYTGNGNLYSYKYSNDAGCYQLYSLNVKSGQYLRVNKDFNVIEATGGSRYIYGCSSNPDDGMKIYDCKTKKLLRKVKPEKTKDPTGYSQNSIQQAMVTGGKLYYLEFGYYEKIVFETSLGGKSTPKEIFRERTEEMAKLCNGMFYFAQVNKNGDLKYYKMDVKTGERENSSMKEYDNAR